jgi:ribonuclease E
MSKKMLIDASHPEETRVVVVDGTRVEELDYESENKKQLRGNVYLARVTRVEPSLQAAFVEYGGNRHGFLAFSEIHPDYYQIPHEDRVALLEAEQAENLEEEEAEETDIETKEKSKTSSDDVSDDDIDIDAIVAEVENDDEDDENGDTDDATETSDDDDVGDATEKEVEEEQEKMLGARRKRQSKRRYKIQEVIKRGQILLIQGVKEERGNKGAAMTTYLSLAGRYCVLMPNTPRGGGISRKISNGSDRKRLKKIMSELSVPQGMGVIVRTAGAKRTKVEIKRDYDYLSRLWDTIRDNTLKSIAPSLIHEEGNLVKRSIRDLYGKDVDSILVQGDEAYRLAKDFIKMLMPSHAKNVQPYKDDIPLFLRYQVEQQIEACLDPVAQLKSGGYLVIHPTEALVSIDVNSGRSTKERNVERTALKTNLEAAEELARQMRLRDLAGLIVVDFIDMDEYRNNRAVEKRMRDVLSRDRARVQMSKISQFGLMEISRQRRRRSLLEGSTASCEHCDGVGRKRSVESSALKAIRAIEEEGIRGGSARIMLKTSPDVAFYLLNEKRDLLNQIAEQSGMFCEISVDESLIRPNFVLEKIEKRRDRLVDPLDAIQKEHRKSNASKSKRQKKEPAQDSETVETDENSEENKPSKRKRRRGRRGGRGRRKNPQNNAEQTSENTSETGDAETVDAQNADAKDTSSKEAKVASSDKVSHESETETPTSDDKPQRKRPARRRKKPAADTATEKTDGKEDVTSEEPAKKPRRSRKKPAEKDVDKDTETAKKPARKKAAPKKAAKDAPSVKEETKETKEAAKKPAAKPRTPRRKKADVKTDASEKTTTKAAAKPAAKAKTAKTKAAKAETTSAKPAVKAKPKPKAEAEKPVTKPDDTSEEKSTKKGWWQKRNPFG